MSEKEKMNQDGVQEQAKETKPAKTEKAKADKPKAAKEKKPGFFKRLGRFFRELKAELKKVAWPSGSDTLKKTGIVIVVCAIFSVIISVYDLIFFKIRTLLENLLIKK
mgnify:CR=1 FL=1